jgi:hypothetical protein
VLKVSSELKQRIMWKWEVPMPDAPRNVLISSWLPQTALLAHNNVTSFTGVQNLAPLAPPVPDKPHLVGQNEI